MGKKLTREEYIEKLNKIGNVDYEILEFEGRKKPVLVKHKKCGNTLSLNPETLLRGGGCSICSGNRKKSISEWNNIIKEKILGYDVIDTESKFLGNTKMTHLIIRHKQCGNVFSMLPYNMLSNNNRCPFCNHGSKNAARKTFEKIMLENSEYKLLEEYNGCKNKLLFLHKKCNTEFLMTPDHFRKGERCPQCAASKGERVISEILDSKNIKYRKQFFFDDLYDKLPLKFDFKIDDVLIEYDGIQHERPVIYGRNFIKCREKFYTMKRHDEMKNLYCKKNKIVLFRIPYTEFNNINEIINKFLAFLSQEHTNLYMDFIEWEKLIIKKEK